MDQVLEILQANQLLDKVTIQKSKTLIFEKRAGTEPTSLPRQKTSAKCSGSVPSEKVKTVNEAFAKLPFPIELTQVIGEGQKMKQYKEFNKVFQEQMSDLVHQNGQVLLVDVWATWCGPCQNPMQHNQDMLVKNEQKWKGKVRIVAVSVDQDKNDIKTRINNKGWNKIQHLTLLGWKGQHPLIKDFNVEGIPFVFLVDKFGCINYVGHPSDINLQERMNQLLQNQNAPSNSGQEQAQINTESIIAEIKKSEQINKIFSKQFLTERYGKSDLFSVYSRNNMTIQNGKLEECKAEVKVSTYEDTPQLIADLKDLLKDFDPSQYKLQENLVKFVEAPNNQNPDCLDCKSKLTYPFYWCKWEINPESFRCRQCVEKKPTQEGKHYAYPQNSVLLNGPWKRIAVKNLGNNVQPQSVESVQNSHGFSCNGCSNCPDSIGQARYICLGCRSDPNYRGDYIDVCESCLSSYIKGDKQIKQALDVQGHTAGHPLLRILYNVQGYYKF